MLFKIIQITPKALITIFAQARVGGYMQSIPQCVVGQCSTETKLDDLFLARINLYAMLTYALHRHNYTDIILVCPFSYGHPNILRCIK